MLTALPLMAAAYCPSKCGDEKKGRKFSPEQFRMQCELFVAREAKLTQSEAQRLFPMYTQMREEQRKLNDEQHRLRREAGKDEISDKRSLEILNRLNELSHKAVQIEIDYDKKMLKIVSASKLLRVKQAEQRFHRKMLDRIANDRRKGPRNK